MINMQQSQKSHLIDGNSTVTGTKFPPYKKASAKVNGQFSIDTNHGQNAMPIVPAKPARTAITIKNTVSTAHQNEQLNRSGGGGGGAGAPNAETDEIEFLLEEIKDLEVPACRTDSEQDFEIAGSRVDLDLSLQLDSPIDTSWYYSSISFLLDLLLLLLLFPFSILRLNNFFVLFYFPCSNMRALCY